MFTVYYICIVLSKAITAQYIEHIYHTLHTTVFTFTLTEPVHNISSYYGSYPPSLGIGLDEFGVSAFSLSLTRGRTHDDSGPPPGAVLDVSFDGRFHKEDAYKRLTQAMSAIAAPIAIDAELAVTTPLLPVDVTENRRLFHAPHMMVCTGNIRSLLDLLPCGTSAGLGAYLLDQWKFFADSRYLNLRLYAEKSNNTYLLRVVAETAGHLTTYQGVNACPVATRSIEPEFQASTKKPRLVAKQVRGYAMTHAAVVYIVGQRSEALGIVDRIPFFMTPLFHTLNSTCPIQWSADSALDRYDRREGAVLRLSLGRGEACEVQFRVIKNFVHTSDFSYSVEKGFEVSGAMYKLESQSEWSATNANLVHWPLQDGSMAYNAVAIATTVIFVFYGKLAKEFFPHKPSLIQRLLIRLGL